MQVLANSKADKGVHLGEGRKPIWQSYQILYLKWHRSIFGGIGHVMLDWVFSLHIIFIVCNPGVLYVDICSVSGKAFAYNFTIILLQVIFSESSGPLEILEAPGKQQFCKGEILHLLVTWIALFDSKLKGHLVKSCEQHLQLFFLLLQEEMCLANIWWFMNAIMFLFPVSNWKGEKQCIIQLKMWVIWELPVL